MSFDMWYGADFGLLLNTRQLSKLVTDNAIISHFYFTDTFDVLDPFWIVAESSHLTISKENLRPCA